MCAWSSFKMRHPPLPENGWRLFSNSLCRTLTHLLCIVPSDHESRKSSLPVACGRSWYLYCLMNGRCEWKCRRSSMVFPMKYGHKCRSKSPRKTCRVYLKNGDLDFPKSRGIPSVSKDVQHKKLKSACRQAISLLQYISICIWKILLMKTSKISFFFYVCGLVT